MKRALCVFISVCVCVQKTACPFNLAAAQTHTHTHTERRFCVLRQEVCFHLSRLGQLTPPPPPDKEEQSRTSDWQQDRHQRRRGGSPGLGIGREGACFLSQNRDFRIRSYFGFADFNRHLKTSSWFCCQHFRWEGSAIKNIISADRFEDHKVSPPRLVFSQMAFLCAFRHLSRFRPGHKYTQTHTRCRRTQLASHHAISP